MSHPTHTLPYPVLSYPTLPIPTCTLPYLTLPYPILSCHVLAYFTLPYPTHPYVYPTLPCNDQKTLKTIVILYCVIFQSGTFLVFPLRYSLKPQHEEMRVIAIVKNQMVRGALFIFTVSFQSELHQPIPWNQTSDVHRGSTLIT